MKLKLTLVSLLLFNAVYAQIRVEGVVRDSIGETLELATIIAINQTSQKLDGYGITNDEGRYRFTLEENTNYKLQVSYIGMKTIQEEITTTQSDIAVSYTHLTLPTIQL